jgi:hypothetical protein
VNDAGSGRANRNESQDFAGNWVKQRGWDLIAWERLPGRGIDQLVRVRREISSPLRSCQYNRGVYGVLPDRCSLIREKCECLIFPNRAAECASILVALKAILNW